MRSSSRNSVGVLLLLLTFLIISARPNQQSQQAVDGELKILTVTVRNSAGRYVMGASRESFELTDEKERRPIEFFENTDAPVSIGILVDTSGSMLFLENREIARPRTIGEAISRFLELSNDRNEYFLMAFDRTPRFLTDWKSGQALLAQKTDIAREGTNTALYDACFAAVEKLQTSHYSKRALILISDGQDNLSRHTFNQLRDLLRDSDVTIYGIAVVMGSDVYSSLGAEALRIMRELVEITGGEVFPSRDKKQLQQAIESITIQLRHQYRIGFRTVRTDPPQKWHRLKLKITARANALKEFSKLTVRTRQGYYTH
jgi:Ca-activated chloride channel family protein